MAQLLLQFELLYSVLLFLLLLLDEALTHLPLVAIELAAHVPVEFRILEQVFFVNCL